MQTSCCLCLAWGSHARSACDELEVLNQQELQQLQQCEDLLKKLGIKQPLGPSVAERAALAAAAAAAAREEEEAEQALLLAEVAALDSEEAS